MSLSTWSATVSTIARYTRCCIVQHVHGIVLCCIVMLHCTAHVRDYYIVQQYRTAVCCIASWMLPIVAYPECLVSVLVGPSESLYGIFLFHRHHRGHRRDGGPEGLLPSCSVWPWPSFPNFASGFFFSFGGAFMRRISNIFSLSLCLSVCLSVSLSLSLSLSSLPGHREAESRFCFDSFIFFRALARCRSNDPLPPIRHVGPRVCLSISSTCPPRPPGPFVRGAGTRDETGG